MELMIVIVIIGILSAVGMVMFGGQAEKAKIVVVKANYRMMVKYFRTQLTMCELGEQIDTWDDGSKTLIKKDCGTFEQNSNWIWWAIANDDNDKTGDNPFDSSDGEGAWWWNKNVPGVVNKGRVACAYDNSIGPGGVPAIHCSARYGDASNDYVETFIYPY
tara:strand:- start:442 stop:924 length:483 start_codon:yes stop_codon:yes gene_type:complete